MGSKVVSNFFTPTHICVCVCVCVCVCEREREREREREISALSNVFKKTNQNHGNKTIKLDYNVIVWH